MATDFAGSILLSLRRIIRSIDQHNKQLGRCYELTVPQLVCLRQLLMDGELTASQLSKSVYLSQATVTGIIDRLEDKGLVTRQRSRQDRRKMLLKLTKRGIRMANDMPWPLQERFSRSLAELKESEIEQIDDMLKRVVEMMEAPPLPIWAFGPSEAVTLDDNNPPE